MLLVHYQQRFYLEPKSTKNLQQLAKRKRTQIKKGAINPKATTPTAKDCSFFIAPFDFFFQSKKNLLLFSQKSESPHSSIYQRIFKQLMIIQTLFTSRNQA